jgi:hypothetical protein
MERAWPKDDIGLSGWDAGRLGKVLAESVAAWVSFTYPVDSSETSSIIALGKERILEEAACVLRDVLHELNSRDEDSNKDLEDVEATAIGETLFNLAEYILTLKLAFPVNFFFLLADLSVQKKP